MKRNSDSDWITIAACSAPGPHEVMAPRPAVAPGVRRELAKLSLAAFISTTVLLGAFTASPAPEPPMPLPARDVRVLSSTVLVEALATEDFGPRDPEPVLPQRRPASAARVVLAGRSHRTHAAAAALPSRGSLASKFVRAFVGSGEYRVQPYPVPTERH